MKGKGKRAVTEEADVFGFVDKGRDKVKTTGIWKNGKARGKVKVGCDEDNAENGDEDGNETGEIEKLNRAVCLPFFPPIIPKISFISTNPILDPPKPENKKTNRQITLLPVRSLDTDMDFNHNNPS